MSDRPAARAIHADVFTDAHRISCRINISSMGLVALLNDNNTSMVEVEDAYFSRIQQPAKIMSHHSIAHLNKVNIPLMVLSRREDFGPSALARGGFARVIACPVLITLAAYEVKGLVEAVSKYDPSAILVGGTTRFMPVYNATATVALIPEPAYSGPVVVINRMHAISIAEIEEAKP